MTDAASYIRTGFYDDFKGYDTLLISVDRGGLKEIQDVFSRLSKDQAQFDFSTLNFLDKKFRVSIKAYADSNDSGLKQMARGEFEWRLIKAKWYHFEELLSALSGGSSNAHQYLDFETGDVDLHSLQVVFSLNEYPLSFWQEHFAKCNE
jgi:hypothetical protein